MPLPMNQNLIKTMTNDEYIIKLSYLEMQDPDNLMIAKLRTGYSDLNAMYLMHQLRALEDKPKPEKAVSNKSASSIEIKLRHLRQSRDELSNSFMSCSTDHQRATVSIRIGELTEQIVELSERLNNFVSTRELHELPANDKYPIPEDGLKLAALQHANRNAIRRTTERINDLFARDPEDRKLRDLETKLRDLKIYKQYIDVEINRRKNI